MASILVKLDKRRANAKGKYPLKLVIFNNQKNVSISLSLAVPLSAWIGDGIQRPIKVTYPGAKMINDRIETAYLKIRKKVIDLEDTGEIFTMTPIEIKARILNKGNSAKKTPVAFISFATDFANRCKSSGTKRNYLHTLNKLNEFSDSELSFEKMNHSFLRQFDEWLEKSGSGVNTRSIHFRNIRALFNRAIDDEIIEQNLYPFRKFKIKSEQRVLY